MYRIAVVGGADASVLDLVRLAHQEHPGRLHFDLFDCRTDIAEGEWTYHLAPDIQTAAQEAAQFVDQGHADILLKGIVTTHDLLHAVLNKDYQLKEQDLLSHVAMIHLPQLGRPLLLTDAGMNIAPNAKQLSQIIDNARLIAKKVGINQPKIAIISAAENYNPKMPSSVLAKEVADHYNGEAATVYGPISLDLALSKHAVAKKHFQAPIQGDADILAVTGIDVGNVIYKALVLFTDVKVGGCLVGTKVPIVLNSRTDSIENKLFALEFAMQQVDGEENK
ncbi:phosphate acyltransferase [Aerococcus kribbianus]|uniref:Phosphate acyltransferase n=1 Tax=Aerococcus kribbianus TaxID=2999064 RepID=A0A9X3JF99_9LACT|nr:MULTISPECIES: phosphate acyltransferase [unclassified Aerococcus]MCZ0718010.1 phosphate acyltransferase [Aerococcus sp. YH-aer221]MCZ0726297.1 phosphate acyltransferase [Aerococcus sp. YH-aer222]